MFRGVKISCVRSVIKGSLILMARFWKKRIKFIPRALTRGILYAVTFLAAWLPFKCVCWITRFLSAVGFIVLIRQKKIAWESLRVAFGREKTELEIRQIFKDCFFNIGKSMTELIYFIEHPSQIKKKVFFENKDILLNAMAQGKGVIVVSGHFGNFPLMLLRLHQEGLSTSAIIRPARDHKAEEYFQKKRSTLGLKTIYSRPRKKCVTESLRALRAKELLFVLLDQHSGSAGGVMVDFFGQKAATAAGPVVFALRTQAPIVPIFIVRQPDDTHKIIVEPPLAIEHGATEEETLVKNVSRITQIIERYVRQYPEEWGWMHRRWKGRSTGKTTI
jgi:Kdo2-lipid IVA lauroyltransferase/acyltransferase